MLSLIYDNLSWFSLPFETLELILSILYLPSHVFYPPFFNSPCGRLPPLYFKAFSEAIYALFLF